MLINLYAVQIRIFQINIFLTIHDSNSNCSVLCHFTDFSDEFRLILYRILFRIIMRYSKSTDDDHDYDEKNSSDSYVILPQSTLSSPETQIHNA